MNGVSDSKVDSGSALFSEQAVISIRAISVKKGLKAMLSIRYLSKVAFCVETVLNKKSGPIWTAFFYGI